MTLIDRLSKLDGPDRELDAEIDRAFGLSVDVGAFSGPWTLYPDQELYKETARYTASVDAAIALAERTLPGKSIDLLREAISELGKKYHWHICRTKPEQVRELPIQVCIALLRAKEASK